MLCGSDAPTVILIRTSAIRNGETSFLSVHARTFVRFARGVKALTRVPMDSTNALFAARYTQPCVRREGESGHTGTHRRPGQALEMPRLEVGEGFRVEGFRVEVVGYCPACAAALD